MSQQPRTAPKFASFKPKSTPDKPGHITTKPSHVDATSEEKSTQLDAPSRSTRKRSLRDDHDSKHKAHRPGKAVKRPSLTGSAYDDRDQQTRIQNRAVSRELPSTDSFYTDLRGDRKIVQFGSLDREDIPSYHSIGYGRIIGSPRGIKIDQGLSDHKSVILHDTSKAQPERLLKVYRDRPSPRLRVIRSQKENSDFVSQMDFIAFTPNHKQKRISEVIDEVDYRSISGKAIPHPLSEDEDLDYVSEPETATIRDTEQMRVQRHSAQLFRRCKENPKSLEVWNALIRYQTELVRPGTELSFFTNAEKRTLADMRIAIYGQAIKHFDKNDPGHARLSAGLLKEGSLIWDTSKLIAKWKEVLLRCPEDVWLWTQYLNLVQSNYSISEYQHCKSTYAECLKILSQAIAKVPSERRPVISQIRLYVLLRFTSFIRDAGYVELAFGMWQIVLESAFFSPKTGSKDPDLASLEKFWEADIPRIGEANAHGWSDFVGEANEGKRQTPRYVKQHWQQNSPFQSFSRLEVASDHEFFLPASNDEDIEERDDPFCMVFFSDMHDILSALRNECPPEALISAFLTFARLPPLGDFINQHTSQAWQLDPYLLLNNQSSGYLDSGPYTSLEFFEINDHDHISAGLLQHVMQTLEQILTHHFDSVIAEYLLALKAQQSPSVARAYAKRLLKDRPDELRLYNAYALVELKGDNFDKACSIWQAALGMHGSLTHETQKYEIMLWHSWARAELTAGHDAEALYRLLSVDKMQLTMQTSPSLQTLLAAAPDRLRAARHFQEGWVQMLDSETYELAVLYAECATWLIYLTGPYALEAALDKCDELSTTLLARSASVAAELLHQAKAGLLHLHVQRKRSHKPTMIRERLSASLDLFPNNSYLLSLYAKNEETIGISDRMRATLRNRTLSSDSASSVQWRHALETEIRRCVRSASGSTENSVRATFARALLSADSLVKHSVELWEMWVTFEQSRMERNRESAVRELKKVFLDGLRFLPWYKHWVVKGLGIMEETGAMSTKELIQVYNVMGERGLRVRYAGQMDDLLL
nr:protein nrde2 like [Quercus suber]